jgi:hypothetical protein
MSWDLAWRHPWWGDFTTLAMAALLLGNAESEGWRRLLLRPFVLGALALAILARVGT